jgi:phospholipid/cholesterol/gamma-HCH transport system substrate-binding protein
MFKGHGFETLLSAAMMAFAVGFFVFMRWQTGTRALSTYELTATVRQMDGISGGADVRISGVKIGTVERLSLDPRSYRIHVTMSIRRDVSIPADSSLSIAGGTMSSFYLTIKPGRSGKTVPPGGELKIAASVKSWAVAA